MEDGGIKMAGVRVGWVGQLDGTCAFLHMPPPPSFLPAHALLFPGNREAGHF